MTRKEVSVLLAGASGLTLTLSNGAQVKLGCNELLRPDDFARAVWAQIGVRVPVRSKRQHDEIVCALFALTAAGELSLVA